MSACCDVAFLFFADIRYVVIDVTDVIAEIKISLGALDFYSILVYNKTVKRRTD